MTSAESRSREGSTPRPGRVVLKVLLAFVVVPALVLEASLHLVPELIPAGYRDLYPAHGLEFFRPGALSEAPIDGLPIPLVRTEWNGPPPADLKQIGIAPSAEDIDARRFPDVRIPSDERGLPNPAASARADTLLVGDSFVVSASYRESGGLIDVLRSSGAGEVYSLGVSGIGPLREGWLLEQHGLSLRPRLVLWFFFGGNDLSDAKVILERRAAGLRVHRDLASYRPVPSLRSPGIAAWILGGRIASGADASPRHAVEAEPLPPLTLRGAAGAPAEPLWFHPNHLARCALSARAWSQHVAWPATQAALLRARDRSVEAGARFALVYLPSKVEANLPYVERDAELMERHLAFGIDASLIDGDPFPRLLAHRSALQELLREFCAESGIAFFSATPALEALAGTGESGFLATDTHWSRRGVEAVSGPLVEFLREAGLLPE